MSSRANGFAAFIKRQGIVFALILVALFFVVTAPQFSKIENILTILRQISTYGVIACGMTYVIISGNFDLSVGSLVSLTCILTISLYDKLGPVPALAIAILAGLVSGVVSGFLVGYVKLNSMIVTLGMMQILQAITLLYSGGKYSTLADPKESWLASVGRGDILGIPTPVIIYLVCIIIFELILKRSVYGRQLLAVGGNPRACRFTGINEKKVVFVSFIISGLMSAIGGIILGGRVGAAQNTIGEGYEFEVIAGVILGGTSLLGGSGSVVKTFVGILIMGILKNGFVMLGFQYYIQWITQWLIIVLVVWIDVATARKKVLV